MNKNIYRQFDSHTTHTTYKCKLYIAAITGNLHAFNENFLPSYLNRQ